jgi:hypothetical protein
MPERGIWYCDRVAVCSLSAPEDKTTEWAIGGTVIGKKTLKYFDKSLPSLPPQISHRLILRLKTELCGKKLATSRLSCGTAVEYFGGLFQNENTSAPEQNWGLGGFCVVVVVVVVVLLLLLHVMYM